MLTINAMGDACPIPVVKTKKAISELKNSDRIEVLVDNEIAVQNLTKMAEQKGYPVSSEKIAERQFHVIMTVAVSSENALSPEAAAPYQDAVMPEAASCIPDRRKNTVVVIAQSVMGAGDDKLGASLLKAFLFSLTQLDTLPSTILFYNGGARVTCEDSPSIEDLKTLESQGVEILTCGTCLNYYGLTDRLLVGSVTNMYVIAQKLSEADRIIRP